jgi:ubiquitin-protein ligase
MSESYLRDEYEEVENCQELDEIGCSISLPNEYNPFQWLCVFIGPKNTPFSGGFFKLKINFPQDYPEEGPSVYFMTKIYHPNINLDDGRVCIDLLNNWKQKRTSMIKVLWAIYILLLKPNPRDPYNNDAAKLYLEKYEEYWKMANNYVRKFAQI